MTFALNELILAFWNIINSRIDAHRILKNKTIAHGINFSAYSIITGLLVWLFKMNLPHSIVFCLSSFFNRQITFDIPLNLRRGLPWDYQSIANPPKALMDRIERFIFRYSYNGKEIAEFYSLMWAVTILFNYLFDVR
jgi:hypothetical protein